MTKICSIDDCAQSVKAKNLCQRHYSREASRRWRAKNPDLNRERQCGYTEAWRAENPDQSREMSREDSRKLRARKRELTVEGIDYDDIWSRQGGYCYLCNGSMDRHIPYLDDDRRVNPEFASVDHLIPISKGGSHTSENLAFMHMACNRCKSTSLVFAMWEV